MRNRTVLKLVCMFERDCAVRLLQLSRARASVVTVERNSSTCLWARVIWHCQALSASYDAMHALHLSAAALARHVGWRVVHDVFIEHSRRLWHTR
jgi:hypothetical protein